MSSMIIPINEENDDLLILYWMSKLYKTTKHSITFRSKLYIFVSHVQQMLYLEKQSICTLRGSIRALLAKVGH
jgi:hypothetical protein